MTSNFIFIEKSEPVQDILSELEANDHLWKMVSTMSNVGGKKDPYGFLPLTMGMILDPSAAIKDSEHQQNTPAWNVFHSVHSFWKKYNIHSTSRCAFFRLPVGGEVLSHIDDGKYYLTRDRFHLSLQGEYEYTCGDEFHLITPGTFFWFDNKKPHSAKNVGDVNRLTLVFDVPHSPLNPQHGK